jgi:hypothetical protein
MRITTVFLCALWMGSEVSAQTFMARVTRDSNGAPIDGVRMDLDRVPVDALPDYTGETDPFGYLTLRPAAGTYMFGVSHPGYSSVTGTVVVAGSAGVFTNVVLQALVPPGGGDPDPGHDLYVETRCVMTGQPLANAPVRVQVFDHPSAGNLVTNRTGVSDARGHLILRGLPDGHYGFRINDPLDGAPVPRWKALASASRQPVTLDHSVRAGLEPEKQVMALEVRGIDVTNANRFSATNELLRGVYVELTGGTHDDNGNFIALLPPRVSVTDDNGSVSFTGLPALTWRATTKRLGYHSFNALIPPGPGGALPALTTLRPALRSNKFFLTLTHPYIDARVLQGLRVRVQGLKDTNTEGVDFANAQVFFDGAAFHWDWHTLFNLVPGRYRLSVDGTGTGLGGSPAPGFTGEIYADLEDKLSANPNLTWTDAELALEARTTLVRGRLWSAETMPAVELLSDYTLPVPPIYNAHTGGVQVVFREYEPANPAQGPWLKPALRTATAMVDANGEFTVRLPAGKWGVELPALTSHWGSHARLRNSAVSVGAEQDVKQGWPYYRWPHASNPPSNGQPGFGNPLIIRGEGQYELDLYLRRQILAISGWVDNAANDPTPGDLFVGAPARRAQATLTPAAGAPRHSRGVRPLHVQPRGLLLPGCSPLGNIPCSSATRATPLPTPRVPASPSPFQRSPPPGVPPAADPLGNPVPFDNLHANNQITATYTPSTTDIVVRHWRWEGAAYDQVGQTENYFTDKQVAYLPNLRFGGGIPVGPFTAWVSIFNVGFQGYLEMDIPAEGTVATFDAYFNGGPLDNLGPLPPHPVTLEIHAVNADDPASLAPGTTITLDNAGSLPAFTPTTLPHVIQNYTGQGLITHTVNPNWVELGTTYKTIDDAEPRVKVEVRLSRATRFTGVVTESPGGAPLANVHVAVKDRFGALLQDGRTDAAGVFDFPAHVNEAGPVYVEFNATGYIPRRLRFGPENPVVTPDPNDPDDKAVMTLAEALSPVPGPVVTDALLDRRGAFLPGVVRVGDTTQNTVGLATNELTMTWEILFDATTVDLELPPFDAPDGTPPAPGAVSTPDEIVDVLLVDPRYYGVTGTPATARFGNPYSEEPLPLPFPLPGLPGAVLDFVRELGGAKSPSVFFRRAEEIEQTGPATWSARGTVPLWQLPPGPFTPRVVAITRRGAVTYHDLIGEELEGVRIPRTLGFMADVMTAVSRNAPLVDHVASYLPKGRFVARPGFVTEIHEGVSAPGYLDYLFRLEVTANESMDSPGANELGFLPGGLGLNMVAQAEATFDGGDNKVGLTLRGDLTATEDIDVSEYAPPYLEPYDPQITIKEPSGGLETTLTRELAAAGPNTVELVHVTNGGIGLAAALNLTPAVSRIPQIGPVLLALDKAGLLIVGGDLDARIDLISTRAWSTRHPQPGDTLPVDRELRRHFLGGDEQTITLVNSNSVDLAFNAGIGLSVALAGERAGARGGLRLAGEDHPRTGRPSLVLTANPDGDWPLFTRLRGQVQAELSAFLDVWVTRLERDYSWVLAAFDIPLSTEGNLVVTPD